MEKIWKINKGVSPIIFVAQHNFPQLRDEKIKLEDMLTGEIAERLAKKLNGFSMVTTKIQPDPNWYKDSSFRRKIFEVVKYHNIKLVVDIHGRKFNSKNKKEIFPNKTYIKKFNSNFDNNWTPMSFVQDKQLALSEDLDSIKIPAVELELRLDARQNILNGEDIDIENLISRILW